MLKASAGEDEESDRAEGSPHPRHARRLIGHAGHELFLLEAYRRNRLPHAIILGGPQGIGKATLAWRLARFLVAHPGRSAAAAATDLSVAPDNRAAAAASALAHPDVGLVRRAVNERTRRFFTDIRVDDVRRAIALFQRAAGAGGYRICIIDSADDLNRSSANALLKVIEEPPPMSLFLIIAHRPGLVLPTIRSRAHFMRMDALPAPAIEQVVGSLGPPWADIPAAEVAAAAAAAQGSVRNALRRLDGRGGEFEVLMRRCLDRLPAIEGRDLHRIADHLAGRSGDDAFEAFGTLVFDWLDAAVRTGAGNGPRRLAPLAETWDRIAASLRESEALNLDRRPLALSTFADLAEAVRAAGGRQSPRLAGLDEV